MPAPSAPTPFWALSIAYYLHLLATIVWIGGLASLAWLVLPSARRALEPAAYAALLGNLQRRLDNLGWLSILVLAGTGLFQMSANPNYPGFLTITNRWALAILVKHIVFLGMVATSAYLTWGLLPSLQRLALRQSKGLPAAGLEGLQRREQQLIRLNLVLGILVLALTALARAS